MASDEEDIEVIKTQPKSRNKELEEFVRNLDPKVVAEWGEDEVIEGFLKPIGMEFMGKSFKDNKINGAVLMNLEENHIKEMECGVLGDRLLFLGYLNLLKKQKHLSDRGRVLWSATTPVLQLAYHSGCGSFFIQLCCPCCVTTYDWSVTGQGIRWRKTSAAINCCSQSETQYIDFRFLKDLEIRREPKFCCFCAGDELLIYADDKDSSTATTGLLSNEPVCILHPDVSNAESIIRNAWAEVRLVSD